MHAYSQPFAELLSRFQKFALQVKPQVPVAQVDVAFAAEHVTPQPPQFAMSVAAFTSQPFAFTESQFK